MRHQAEEERAKVHPLPLVVRLREAVVVERERGLGREEIGGVVAERRQCVAVLHEVAAGPGERESPDEARRLGHPVHAVTRLGGEGQRDLLRPHGRANEAELEARQEVLEGSLVRVDAQPGHEAVDGGQEHEPLRAERDAFRIEPETRRVQPRLVEGDASQHGVSR